MDTLQQISTCTSIVEGRHYCKKRHWLARRQPAASTLRQRRASRPRQGHASGRNRAIPRRVKNTSGHACMCRLAGSVPYFSYPLTKRAAIPKARHASIKRTARSRHEPLLSRSVTAGGCGPPFSRMILVQVV